jgi:hypothetical protein
MGPAVLLGVLVYCGAFASGDTDFMGRKRPGAPPLLATPYLQDWEVGVEGWNSERGPGDPVVRVRDTRSPERLAVQRITRAGPGSYVSPLIQVASGQLYCVGGWIRWVGGGWPSIGLERYAPDGAAGASWLISRPGYPDGLGGQVVPVVPKTRDWRWYAREVVMPPRTVAVRLKDGMLEGEGKAGQTLGYFDDLALTEGPCPARPQTPSARSRRGHGPSAALAPQR